MTKQEQQEIFDQWQPQLKQLVVKIIRAFAFTRENQEDLFQEISLQTWQSIPGFKKESMVSTWLYRIALNTAIKWSQKEKKHRNITDPDTLLQVRSDDASQPRDERLTWVYEEIAQMNLIDRSVTLLLLDGLSYKQMAGVLGITESNIGVKINRIKKRLTEKSKNINHGI